MAKAMRVETLFLLTNFSLCDNLTEKDSNHWINEFTVRPVNVGVKGTELWISKNQLISFKVHDIEAFHVLLA